MIERVGNPAFLSHADLNHNVLPDGYEAWVASLPAAPESIPASVDMDNDGIDNQWEHRFGLPMRSAAGSMMNDSFVVEYPAVPPWVPVVDAYGDMESFTAAMAAYPAELAAWAALQQMDPDHDGLCNHSEYLLRSHPRIADSDHDGVNDGVEYALQSSPTNAGVTPGSPGNGLPGHPAGLPGDGSSPSSGTQSPSNPSPNDLDGDGVTTEQELEQGTSDNNVDSDSDGYADDVDAVPYDRAFALQRTPMSKLIAIDMGVVPPTQEGSLMIANDGSSLWQNGSDTFGVYTAKGVTGLSAIWARLPMFHRVFQ